MVGKMNVLPHEVISGVWTYLFNVLFICKKVKTTLKRKLNAKEKAKKDVKVVEVSSNTNT